METSFEDVLRGLLVGRSVAALATLHDGRPAVSMVPFAAEVVDGQAVLVAHVSGLAAHTRDMRESPPVSILLVAAESAGVSPQALPRVSIAARAEFVPPGHAWHAVLRRSYLARFPDAEPMFGFGDFSLVAFVPESVRLVAGFAQARTMGVAALAAALAGGRGRGG